MTKTGLRLALMKLVFQFQAHRMRAGAFTASTVSPGNGEAGSQAPEADSRAEQDVGKAEMRIDLSRIGGK
jgi:hypothetical protein